MGMDYKELFAGDARHRNVLKAILESPFVERQALGERLDVPSEELDGLLATLVEKMVVLELASQADSSIEARVPKTVYMINPEEEAGVREHV
jgi:hypothetical protein